jgi:hypothetical protein
VARVVAPKRYLQPPRFSAVTRRPCALQRSWRRAFRLAAGALNRDQSLSCWILIIRPFVHWCAGSGNKHAALPPADNCVSQPDIGTDALVAFPSGPLLPGLFSFASFALVSSFVLATFPIISLVRLLPCRWAFFRFMSTARAAGAHSAPRAQLFP